MQKAVIKIAHQHLIWRKQDRESFSNAMTKTNVNLAWLDFRR